MPDGHGLVPAQVAGPCPTCNGTGKIIKDPCKPCGGTGRVRTSEEGSVQIPEGMSEGVRLRVPNKGEPGVKGAPAGNLYVQVEIEPHQFFTREGYDIHVTVPISISQAVLGGKVTVPTLNGEQKVALGPGTQPGTVKILRNHGAKNLQGDGYGNLVVEFQVHVPTSTSAEQKELLAAFAKQEKVPSVTEFHMRSRRQGGGRHR